MEERIDKEILVSSSTKETEEIAFKFAQRLKDNEIVFLDGDLGAGKTTFVKGLARGLGIKHTIISPTFIIVRSYKLPLSFRGKPRNLLSKMGENNELNEISPRTLFNRNDSKISLYHADLYRLNDESDLQSTGILDIINEKNKILVIEWPEKLGKFKPLKRWEIKFKIIDENKREIEFSH